MKKIAFYLHNRTISEVDCTKVLDGNPGIGGSEYSILLTALLLTQRQNGLDVTLYVQSVKGLPSEIKVEKVVDLREAIMFAEKSEQECLVFKHEENWIEEALFDELFDFRIKLIAWCHNFVSRRALNFYAKHNLFVKLICVGKEQLDLYRDHKAFLKSDYIFNAVDFSYVEKDLDKIPNFKNRENIVTYIGGIHPQKGFHLLAKAWPEVLAKFPDAQLHIIGSGKLYDRNARMGKYQIAEESYENSFIQYITQDGELLPSVHFHGLLGASKNDILKKTKVGVPNPSGVSETFGYTAVEMQLMGAIIATKRCPGYLDTVFTNGLLYKNDKQLANAICAQLMKDDNSYLKMYSALKDKFSLSIIVEQWEQFLLNIESDIYSIHLNDSLRNIGYDLKWLKEINRIIKKTLPYAYVLLPTVSLINSVLKKLLNLSFVRKG